ncbi:hypothetical protein FIU97_14730 [Roseivivax sp. THAF40]|uniref:hypothetical protein n=1 Tax=Roseivivax sp. THAF40 TaxID=2587858 RepID=UPI001267DA38|nr:hypothetical protein [Roseivivax sp. THAF40]QFT47835.1 hypothetical protein FIU97_14730 [Roseivivax sp. THAF40]
MIVLIPSSTSQARAVLADIVHHSDREIRRACLALRADSTVPRDEKEEARELQGMLRRNQ